jgi:hypothetical protein
MVDTIGGGPIDMALDPRAPSSSAFLAAINLAANEQGGRNSPIFNGYRCNCWLGDLVEGHKAYWDASFFLDDPDSVIEPGSSGIALVAPHMPEAWLTITDGASFDLCEGPRRIGVAKRLPNKE